MASLRIENTYGSLIIENLIDENRRLKSDLKEKTDLLILSENRQKSLEKTILSLSATCREQECTIQELEETIEELEADEHDGNNDEQLVDVEMIQDEYEDLDDEEMDEEEEEEEDPADDDDSDNKAIDKSEDEDLEETLDAADLVPSGSSVPSGCKDTAAGAVERENNVEMVVQEPEKRHVNLIETHSDCEKFEKVQNREETVAASEKAPIDSSKAHSARTGYKPALVNVPVDLVKDATESENGVHRGVQAAKSAMKTTWECQLCGVECSTQRNNNLQTHVGVHNAFSLPCVVQGCSKVSKELQTLRYHLISKHKKRASDLNGVESQKLRDLRHEFWRKTKPLQSVFFPEAAFVGYARKQRSGAAVKCKKCGESVAARNSVRIAHVLSHIKVRSECPIGGCNRVFAGLKELHRHLEKDHRTNLMKMAESEIQKFIEGQTRVNGAVNSVFHQYFE